MKNEATCVKALRLLSPILIFPLLFLPYSLLNSAVIVEIFGCGCPTLSTDGVAVYSRFNANDFTACFWFAAAVGAVLLAFFQSKKVMAARIPLRVLYLTGVAVMSLAFVFAFNRLMMWC